MRTVTNTNAQPDQTPHNALKTDKNPTSWEKTRHDIVPYAPFIAAPGALRTPPWENCVADLAEDPASAKRRPRVGKTQATRQHPVHSTAVN